MSKKTIIIGACTAILLVSAAGAWGTVSRIVAKQTQHPFAPPETRLKIDTLSLPNRVVHDRSLVFTDYD
jgi:hypothetical protein